MKRQALEIESLIIESIPDQAGWFQTALRFRGSILSAILRLLPTFAVTTKLHLRQQPIAQELDTLISAKASAYLKQAIAQYK